MKSKKYSGVVVPAITPLTQDYKLDHGSVEKMFNHFYDHGVMPFILGTTGESASLPLDVKKDFITTAARLKRQGTVLYAGIASNVMTESVELAKFCVDSGIDVVAANLPSYYGLSRHQIKKYYEELADAVPGPLIIYNIPATTHMSIPLDLIDELSYHPNIVGTKDSERSEERLKQSLSLWKDREDFSHFLGWAAKSGDALLDGSDGLIPSTGNLSPLIYSQMVKAVGRHDVKPVAVYQKLSDEFGDLYQKGRSLGESLAALKVLMGEHGLCQPHMMPPLLRLKAAEETELLRSYKGRIIIEEIHITDTHYEE